MFKLTDSIDITFTSQRKCHTFSYVKTAYYNPRFNLIRSTLIFKFFDRFKTVVYSNLVMAVAMATADLKG